MKLEPAICTQCGATLSVNSMDDAAICPYCNTPFIVDKGIQKFNAIYTKTTVIHSDAVNIYNSGYPEFDIRDGVLVKYNGRAEEITIPEGVRKIEAGALKDAGKANNGFKKVVIPGSLKTLDAVSAGELYLSEGVEEVYFSGHILTYRYRKISFPSSIKRIHPGKKVELRTLYKDREGWLKDVPKFEFPNGKTRAAEQFANYYQLKCLYCGGEITSSFLGGLRCELCKRKLRYYYEFEAESQAESERKINLDFPMD